jgi:hypothetical protein
VDHRAGLGVLDKRELLCPFRDSNSYIVTNVMVQENKGRCSYIPMATVPFLHLFDCNEIYSCEQLPSMVDEICALLGYYAQYGVNSVPTFRDNLSFSSSRVKQLECMTLEDGTDSLSRNVGRELPLRCAISKKDAI